MQNSKGGVNFPKLSNWSSKCQSQRWMSKCMCIGKHKSQGSKVKNKVNVKCEVERQKASGQQSQTRSQNDDAGRGRGQFKNAHFWFHISLAVLLISSLSTLFLHVWAMCQMGNDVLMSLLEVHWPKREPHTWSWLDHLSYNLKWHKKLTYMWGFTPSKRRIGVLCARWELSLISHFVPFQIIF